jgi:hypothetical protein
MLRRWEVDGQGAGSCSVSGPGVSRVESSGSGAIQLTIIQFNSILYFNMLTQELQEPITESAQEDKINTKSRKL